MRILVIEDNPRLLELMAEDLKAAGYVIDTAKTAADARSFLGIVDYDLLVLDLSLPDGDGGDLLRELRRSGRSLPVLVATARIEVHQRVATLNDGADDYLVKPFDRDELIARVRAILRRPQLRVQPVLRTGNLMLDLDRLVCSVSDRPVELPRREMTALEILLRHHDSLVPRRRLEQGVYAIDEAVTPNALEAVVSRLRKRLDTAEASVSITAMRGIGYLLSEKT
ncbi:MAG: response regulator [Methylocella sp.]